MRERLIHEAAGQRTFVIVLESGDEVMSCLNRFVQAKHLDAAQFTAIGAFSGADLAYFDWEQKKYLPNAVEEQVEVASFIGDVAVGPDGKPALHVHCVLGRGDGSALAGHLTKAHVRPTLEIVLTESPAHLRKRHDPESGLALIDPEASSGTPPGKGSAGVKR
jgi:predicted DNA-binding protein with PD1-like motif